MSTRSTVIVKGQEEYGRDTEYIRAYKHSDGYPTGNLPIIAKAIQRLNSIYSEYIVHFGDNRTKIIPESLMALFVGESVNVYGVGAIVEQTTKNIKEASGKRYDVEWTYVLDIDNKNVEVYSSNKIEKCTTNPEEYVMQITKDYQQSELRKIKEAVRSIQILGWTVNTVALDLTK